MIISIFSHWWIYFLARNLSKNYHPEGDPKPTYEGDSVRRVGHGV